MCKNRRFQNRAYKKTYPFPTEGKGWGVAAGESIKQGDFIIQYIGEIFSENSLEGKTR